MNNKILKKLLNLLFLFWMIETIVQEFEINIQNEL